MAKLTKLQTCADLQPLDRLASHLRDQVEVLGEMQNNQAGELSGGRREGQGYSAPGLAAVATSSWTSQARSSMDGVRYWIGMAASGRHELRSPLGDRSE